MDIQEAVVLFYFLLVIGGILLAVALSVIAVIMLTRLAKAADKIAKNLEENKQQTTPNS